MIRLEKSLKTNEEIITIFSEKELESMALILYVEQDILICSSLIF